MSHPTALIRQAPKPYEGKEPYIFVSYSHSDSERVLPILNWLDENGFRFWFDTGIELGSEWTESIAQHLAGCAVCVAFISNASVQSMNCRQEIGYALKQKKSILSIYLESATLSMGMDMQLSAYQQIYAYDYANMNRFFTKLADTSILAPCKRKDWQNRKKEENQEENAKKKQRTGRLVACLVLAIALIAIAATLVWHWLKRPIEVEDPPYHISLVANEATGVRAFQNDVEILRGRLNAFADGEEYQMTVTDDEIDLILPRQLFGGIDAARALKCYFSRPIRLYAFNRENDSEYAFIKRDEIAQVTIKEKAVEDADAAELGIEGDSYAYLEIVLTDACAQRLSEQIESWGSSFAFAQDMEEYSGGWYYYHTYPTGDGKTFCVINTDPGENFLKTLHYNLTNDSLSNGLYYKVYLDDVAWESVANAETPGKNQCDGDAFDEKTITIAYAPHIDSFSAGRRLDARTALISRLDTLDQPYAVGSTPGEPNTLYVKTGFGHMSAQIISMLGYPDYELSLRAGFSEYSMSCIDSMKTSRAQDGSYGLAATVKEFYRDDFARFLKAAFDKGTEVTLYLGNIQYCSATMDAVPDDGVVVFDRLSYVGDTPVSEEDAWMFALMEAIFETGDFFSSYSAENYQFEAGASASDFGVVDRMLLSDQQALAQAVRECCPDADVAFDDSETGVSLHLSMDETFPERATSLVRSIYEAFDFERSQLASVTFYLTDKDGMPGERSRIWFSKYISMHSIGEQDEGFIYAKGVFAGEHMAPYLDALRQIEQNDPFYVNLSVRDNEYLSWSFE